MNYRYLLILLGLLVAGIIGVGVGGMSVNSTPSREHREETATLAQIEAASTETAKKKVDWEKLGRLSFFDDLPKPALPLNYEQFLSIHGETPANLIAVFERSNDERWLKRAMELHPDSPIVLMSAILMSRSVHRDEGRIWINKFKEVDANNPIPWIISACDLWSADQTDEAILEFKAALQRPAFYLYVPERISADRAILEWSGTNGLEAELMANMEHKVSIMPVIMGIGKRLEFAKSGESTDSDSKIELARIQYGIGKMFQTHEASRILLFQMEGMNLERLGIKALPEAEQAQRLAELDADKKNFRSLIDSAERLFKSKNEDLLAKYLRKLRTEGELSAMRWLQSQEAEK